MKDPLIAEQKARQDAALTFLERRQKTDAFDRPRDEELHPAETHIDNSLDALRQEFYDARDAEEPS